MATLRAGQGESPEPNSRSRVRVPNTFSQAQPGQDPRHLAGTLGRASRRQEYSGGKR